MTTTLYSSTYIHRPLYLAQGEGANLNHATVYAPSHSEITRQTTNFPTWIFWTHLENKAPNGEKYIKPEM